MTRYRRAASVVGIAVLLAMALVLYTRHSTGFFSVEKSEAAKLPPSRIRKAYVLPDEGWLRFALPHAQNRVSLVTNANVARGDYVGEDLSATYALDYRMYDPRGILLREGQYSFRGRSSTVRDATLDASTPAQFYLGGGVVPLGTRSAVLRLDGFEQEVARVDVRLASAQKIVRDVVVRTLHMKEGEEQASYLWNRIPRAKKIRYAAGNIYSIDLLTPDEKAHLLSNRWGAVAPQGIEDEDYEARRLYQVRVTDSSRKRERILPRGLYVGDGRFGSVPIPAGDSCIRLEFHRVEEEGHWPADGECHLHYYNPEGDEPLYVVVPLEGEVTHHTMEVRGGTLEVTGSLEFVLRASVVGSLAEAEITPGPSSVASYRLEPEEPVDFFINGSESTFRVVRLAVRTAALPPLSLGPTPAVVQYSLLDALGEVIERGALAHDKGTADFDALLGFMRGLAVSEPSHHHFWLPPGCARLRLTSPDVAVLVNGYTRLTDLPRVVNVPETYLPFERRFLDRRNWFSIKPENYSECVRSGREVFVRQQARPPRTPAEEERFYVSHRPRGGGNVFQVMAPADAPTTLEEIGNRSLYAEIPRGEELPLEFVAPKGVGEVRPTLLCLTADDDPFELKVTIDGVTVFREEISGRMNRFRLAPVSTDVHPLEVTAPQGARVFLGSVGPHVGNWFVKRAISFLDSGGLSYQVTKTIAGSQLVFLRLYTPASDFRRHRVRVSLQGFQRQRRVSSTWTYVKNVYDLRAPRPDSFPFLWSNREPVAGGEPFIFRLGEDVPPGVYNLRIEPEGDTSGYVSVTQSVPGRKQSRRMFLRAPDPKEGGDDE